MNIPRSTLQRRRFLHSGSVLALGAASTIFAGRKFCGPPFQDPSKAPLVTAEPIHTTPAPGPLVEVEREEPPELPPVRPLEDEEEYAEFLASLELRHLSPHEVIDPHRGIVDGISNSLPPKEMWERLAPTLKLADEIRERLELPLCRITSAFRAPEYNAMIPGAVPHSYHTRNQALDLVYYCSARKAYDMALKLRREGFFRGGVGLYPTFIHLDTRGYAATWRRV